jgi:hypothetical protein
VEDLVNDEWAVLAKEKIDRIVKGFNAERGTHRGCDNATRGQHGEVEMFVVWATETPEEQKEESQKTSHSQKQHALLSVQYFGGNNTWSEDFDLAINENCEGALKAQKLPKIPFWSHAQERTPSVELCLKFKRPFLVPEDANDAFMLLSALRHGRPDFCTPLHVFPTGETCTRLGIDRVRMRLTLSTLTGSQLEYACSGSVADRSMIESVKEVLLDRDSAEPDDVE